MTNVLFEDIGDNYRVPGLPYEDTYRFVRPIILDDIPSKEEIISFIESSDQDTLTNPWPFYAVQGFKDYIPTTFRKITQGMPNAMFSDLFGIGKDWIPEQDRVLLQLQTEIEAKGATLDAAIISYRRELGTVVNKAHVLNRLYNIGRIYDHLKIRDYPFLFGDLTDESTWDDALSEMKMQFIEYMMEVPIGSRTYPTVRRSREVSQVEIMKRYPYVGWIKETLGDNLMGILLYGSAARSDDPAVYSDFDNWVRVRDIREAHRMLRGTMPTLLEGKVVKAFGEIEGGKHIGIHLFPESDEYLYRHIRFLHDSREFQKHTLVLDGEFDFPVIAMDELVERGISQAYVKLKTITGSLNWAYLTPEKILGKPNLFEFIVKNVRFFLQHSLNATEGPRFRDKQELNALLAEMGLSVPVYEPDLDHIRESLLYAMEGVFTLQKELILNNRVPDLGFLK